MAMTTRLLPDSLQISLPPAWSDIPLKEPEIGKATEQTLQRLGSDLTRAEQRQVEIFFDRVRQISRQQRIVLAGGAFQVEGEGEGDRVLVAAGVAASVTDRASLGTDVPLVADVLIKAFSGRTREGEVQFDEIEPPVKVALAGTEAVKLVRLMRMSGSDGTELKQFTQSYLLPVAMGDGLIVLQFSTINLEYARQFSELFEKIAGTLRILYPDDPTFLDDETTQPTE
jgi:hypothetical protein